MKTRVHTFIHGCMATKILHTYTGNHGNVRNIRGVVEYFFSLKIFDRPSAPTSKSKCDLQ